jgi:hypothetical protein
LTIVIDQGTHFINNVIHYLINHFILRHISFTIYYPQGNKQAKSINKFFDTLRTKLVNENRNDLDEHMSIISFFYKIILKVGISHTPFQFVYGLPLATYGTFVTIQTKTES